jgi:hypothetical protein
VTFFDVFLMICYAGSAMIIPAIAMQLDRQEDSEDSRKK